MRKINWDNVVEELKSVEGKKFEKKVDVNLYSPKLVNDTATVVMRFLPAPEGDVATHIAKVMNHSHKDPVSGKWLIAKCPRTNGYGEKCPVCEYASEQWKGGNKKIAKLFHKPSYFVNVLIIKDSNTPENNGKILVYRLGKKLYEKIMNTMNPSEEDRAAGISPIPVFDYEHGANFILKAKVVSFVNEKTGEKETNLNYDESKFSTPSMISIDGKTPLKEKEVDALIEPKLISLKTYMEDDIDSYDKLYDRLNRFLGVKVTVSESSGDFEDTLAESSREEKSRKTTSFTPKSEEPESDDDFFRNLREQG